MNKQQAEIRRWLDAQSERDEFAAWALEQAPVGEVTVDLVDFTALLVLARRNSFAAWDFGLPRESLAAALKMFYDGLPAEHQAWIDVVEGAYQEHLSRFMAEPRA